MNANPILLQKKYARVVELFAKENNISQEKALDIFYHSELYKLMSEGVSDMHCMSDEYLVRELEEEKNIKQPMHLIEEAYELLRKTKNGVSTPQAEGNPSDIRDVQKMISVERGLKELIDN